MSDCFGVQAARLAGWSAVLLGWTADTFWRATPEELATAIAARLPPGPDGAQGLSFDDVTHLMERFPDG